MIEGFQIIHIICKYYNYCYIVLAMYPQTTCFFKALVKASPKTSYDGYEVLFEDDFNQYTIMMVVSQRFVVSYPSLEIIHKDDEIIGEY